MRKAQCRIVRLMAEEVGSYGEDGGDNMKKHSTCAKLGKVFGSVSDYA